MSAAQLPEAPDTPRRVLWAVLVPLVAALLATLVWLAGRQEALHLQDELDSDTAAAAEDIRTGLVRRAQSLQALSTFGPPRGSRAQWTAQASQLLRDHRELLRIEWRRESLDTVAAVDSPYRPPAYAWLLRAGTLADVQLACAQARRQSQPAYSSSYYLPQQDGTGLEVMELCVPHFSGGTVTGYVVATYALREILASLVGPKLTRNQEVLFTEPDGTRLALYGAPQRGLRTFTSQQLLDLAGNTLVLRMNSWRGAPDPFPNVLTALVTAMLCVAKGLPNKVIADELDISVRTVEVHRARVFDKMNVKSAVELANSLRER